MKDHLDEIKGYLKGIMNDIKNSDTWKIQLIIAINFIILRVLMKSVSWIQRVITYNL